MEIGHILTNAHVVKNPKIDQIFVLGKSMPNEGEEARLVWLVPEHDVAVLKTVKPEAIKPLKLLSVNVEKGAQVWSLGYPGKQGENMRAFGESFEEIDATLTTGIVSRVFEGSLSESSVKYPIIQHTAEISPGNSGGPLLDECSYVVGINTATTSSTREEVNDTDFFAVGSQGTLSLLKSRVPGIAGVEKCVTEEPQAPQTETLQEKEDPSPETKNSNPKKEEVEVNSSNEGLDKNLIGFLFIFLLLGLAYFFYRRGAWEVKSAPGPIPKGSPSSKQDGDKEHATKILRMSGFNDKGAPVSFAFETNASSNDQLWIIGRSASFSDYQIESQGISRAHAQVKVLRSEILVRDLGSTNGTILNGKKLPPFQYSRLSIGDEIQIATCTLAITT